MKTGQKIVALLMVLSFVFALVSTAIAADDPKIHQITLIYSSKQRFGKGIDKTYVSEEFLKDFFGLRMEKLSGNKFKVNDLYYPYTNKYKQYKGKFYFDVETFCKFFGIKYEKLDVSTFDIKDATIPMFTEVDVKGPTEMNYKMGTVKTAVKTLMVKGREFLSIEDLKLKIDDSQKSDMGIIKFNKKIVYRWIDKDEVTYVYLKDINYVLSPTQQLTKTK